MLRYGIPFKSISGGQHAPVRIAPISQRGSVSAGMAGVSVDLSSIAIRYPNRFGGVNMLRNIQYRS
ncbi:hypothetical protein [Arcticibacter tournemirensis]|uniref:hypothetical protein n=1 Tax=Arcticibacter tournemirensis TaxID=699437 RepID=UPI001150DA5B|nr:hypothetical protein [Arcticibacter tournemirensis]